jgi:hypothetical protein
MEEKRKWTSKDTLKQSEIIGIWVKETQKAYSIENITDGHIISYLAQKELGFHKEITAHPESQPPNTNKENKKN